MTNADWEVALLALLVWREASGEPVEGKLAVANVVRNRVIDAKLPDQWDEIIDRKFQFSSITAPGDPGLVRWPTPTDPSWIDSMNAAARVHDLGGCDNTGGATMYCNLALCDPAWAHAMTQTVVIGHHTFFK